MCGIFGFCSPGSSADQQRALLERMGRVLHHRGPDDSGAWFDPLSGTALGHRRLSIVDLSPLGHQPMESACGRYILTFNGEIYNFKALRLELENSGRVFRGHSDTEVLLAGISVWGLSRTVPRLNGMFAMGVWDRADRRLHLVRDRMGEKPLYYGWSGSTFLFASELKAIIAHLGARPPIRRDALALYLRHSYVPGPASIYEGFYKLPPASSIMVDPFQPGTPPSPQPYWSAREIAERGEVRIGTSQEAITELDCRLREAVSLRMEADVPLGAFLSGGIDSTSVVALMQAQSTRPVRTFTIGFQDSNYNEAVEANRVARHLKTDHTELYVSPKEAMDVIPQLPFIYDEPFADSSQIPTYLVSKMARRQVAVSLSGDGGDELFGGYNRYYLARNLMRRIGKIPRPLRHLASDFLKAIPGGAWNLGERLWNGARNAPAHRKALSSHAKKLASVLAINDPWEVYRELVSHWPLSGSPVLGSGRCSSPPVDDVGWTRVGDPTQRMMLVDLVTYLPDDILTKVDRASMSVSLESRAPFLDHTLVEFALSLPMDLKFRDGKSKWLLKQMAYRYVPASLLDRPKMGFGVPLGEWLRGPLRTWAEDVLSEARLAADGYLDPHPIRTKLHEHLSGRHDWPHHLWDVLMFQSWLHAGAEQTSTCPFIGPSSPPPTSPTISGPPASGPRRRPLKVLHLISGLRTGGAEHMLLKLLEHTERSQIEPTVISMTDEGTLGARIRALGIPLQVIGMKRGLPTPRGLLRIAALVRHIRPDILHTWMYHANLVGTVLKAWGLPGRLVCAIRADVIGARNSVMTWGTIYAGALLSRFYPSKYLYNATTSQRNHLRLGYAPAISETIPNGFNLTLFKPSAEARLSIRKELALSEDTHLIGMSARFKEGVKDHHTFLKAAAQLLQTHPTTHFILFGRDVDKSNGKLMGWLAALGLQESTHLLGERTDVPTLNAALDIAALVSNEEAFPNAVGEAMACGVPCVATDVGDCRTLIGEDQFIVPPGTATSLADTWRTFLDSSPKARDTFSKSARARILRNYSIETIAKRYQDLYITFFHCDAPQEQL